MSFQPFSSFSRRGKSSFRAFGKSRRSAFRVPDVNQPDAFDITEDVTDRIANEVGDRSLAKRVRELQGVYPAGSLPELVVMDWLSRHRIPFQFQVPVAGGRSIKGGMVLDFVVPLATGLLSLQVAGYYHDLPLQERVDQQQRLLLRRIKVQGQQVKAQVVVWERRILDKNLREQTLQSALRGIELGR